MVIRYSYNSQVHPPAPFVLVKLRDPTTGAEVLDVPAQVDSGADRTVLPVTIVQALQLSVAGAVTVIGFGGTQITTPLYGVDLGIHTQPHVAVAVIGSPSEPWVLLGRDILNAHRLLLDGPALGLEID
jgi:hypothetical protein